MLNVRWSGLILTLASGLLLGGCWVVHERERGKQRAQDPAAVAFSQGRALIDGQEVFLAGIVYHPVPPCAGADYDFTDDEQIIDRDLPLLEALNVNPGQQLVLRLVRAAQPDFLDRLWGQGIMVIPGLHVSHRQDFINKEDVRIHLYRYRESQSYFHP